MLKKFLVFALIMFFPAASFAIEDVKIDSNKEAEVQKRLNDVGLTILNANKIDGRIVFVYDKTDVKEKLKLDKTLLDREIVVYGYEYKFVEDDNELAAFLSRRIAEAYRSYPGLFKGRLNSLKIKAAPRIQPCCDDYPCKQSLPAKKGRYPHKQCNIKKACKNL